MTYDAQDKPAGSSSCLETPIASHRQSADSGTTVLVCGCGLEFEEGPTYQAHSASCPDYPEPFRVGWDEGD